MNNISDEIIKEIAEEIEIGFTVYYNIKTGKIISFRDMEDFYMEDEENPWQKEKDEIDENIDDLISFEEMDTHSSFKMMEKFIETIDNEELQEKLYNALSKSKPFRRFRDVLNNNNKELNLWYKFKSESYIEWVREQITSNDNYEG